MEQSILRATENFCRLADTTDLQLVEWRDARRFGLWEYRMIFSEDWEALPEPLRTRANEIIRIGVHACD